MKPKIVPSTELPAGNAVATDGGGVGDADGERCRRWASIRKQGKATAGGGGPGTSCGPSRPAGWPSTNRRKLPVIQRPNCCCWMKKLPTRHKRKRRMKMKNELRMVKIPAS